MVNSYSFLLVKNSNLVLDCLTAYTYLVMRLIDPQPIPIRDYLGSLVRKPI
jgi:hypothetical protein